MMMTGWRIFFLLSSLISTGLASASHVQEDQTSIFVYDAVSELVKRISAARDWDINQVHILNIDSENVKFTRATVYELDIQIGGKILPAKFIDEVTNWEHLGVHNADTKIEESEKRTKDTSWNAKTLQPVLKPFHLNGPVDLSFASSETFQHSSEEGEEFADFRNVNLAVGSSIEVSGAQEVSLAQPVELSLPINNSSPIRSLAASIQLLAARRQINGLQQDDDASRLSLSITGPTLMASITGFNLPLHQAEQNLNIGSVKVHYEESEISSPDSKTDVEKGSLWPFPVLNSSDPRLSILEEMLKLYIGYSKRRKSLAILHAKVAASTFVLFEFEIERELNSTEEFKPEVWPEWKTRPNVKMYSFQVFAKVEDNTLIPITVQPLKNYKAVETYAWRDVTSNISYTSFSTYLGPFSPMTLDIY